MMSLYICTNLFVAASWVIFRILPKSHLRYRATKSIAQTMLSLSFFAMPIFMILPDQSFPNFSSPVRMATGLDVDSPVDPKSSLKILRRSIAAVPQMPTDTPDLPSSIGLWMFLTGMFLMFARRLWSWHKLSNLLEGTLRLHKIGRVSVGLSDAVAIPFSVLFLGRAYIVLPTELVPYRKDFKIALRHEVEHHRRLDTLWAVLLEWLICGFYVNPAIYFWRKTILQLQELACDEALIGRMGISQHDYGSCLLRVAEMALGRRFVCEGTTCMIPTSESNGRSFLRRRIKMFAQHERSTAKKAAALTLGTLSGLVLLACAYVAQAAVRLNGQPNPGKPIFDGRIQPLAEEVLKKGMALHNASGGFAIITDSARGTVIAAVSLNNGFDNKLKGDWALSYPLQPGSVLKPLIVASALQHKITKIDEMHNCEKGKYAFGKNLFHDVKAFDQLSTADTVAQSSNICTIKIGQKLGAKGIETALREFGIGKNGSVKDFPEARAGYVPKAGVTSDENYIGFISHGSSDRTNFYVTPLEMVEAYGAIANGGRLMKAIGADGKQSPDMIRDVLSPETSSQMRDVLKKVVEDGTATGIKGSAIQLAGKTSTVVNGNRRITGFIGYAPADNPKVVVYVAMFDPKGSGKVGSNTAAPVFREIVEKTVPIFNP